MTTEHRPQRGQGRKVSPRVVVAGVIAVLALVFILQNRGPVGVHLITLTLSAPLWLLLVVMVGVGLLVGYVSARRR
ncbi:DUF1049 domain-containing protein [Pseudonocardia xishanensis]|uniref:Integral membrane protein n=1 Tax=Pseudonocardia xishanensis TaxID=630995 RepID=A0ABP8S162_9PSEU